MLRTYWEARFSENEEIKRQKDSCKRHITIIKDKYINKYKDTILGAKALTVKTTSPIMRFR